jgi:hypothetical protein
LFVFAPLVTVMMMAIFPDERLKQRDDFVSLLTGFSGNWAVKNRMALHENPSG